MLSYVCFPSGVNGGLPIIKILHSDKARFAQCDVALSKIDIIFKEVAVQTQAFIFCFGCDKERLL